MKELLDKPFLNNKVRIKEVVYEWKWQDLKDIKVLFPLDKRKNTPTIFFSVDEEGTKKVPHYILEEEPCNIVEGGTHI